MRINTEQLRILVLLMIEKHPDGINADLLLDAVYHAAVADFIDLPDVMEHLTGEKLIAFSHTSAKLCTVTPLGKSVLSELGAVVPAQALRAVERAYESLANGVDYSSSVQADENGAHFFAKATQNGADLCQLSLAFADEKTAYAAKQTFDKRPEEILNAIRAVLTGNADFLLRS